MVLTNAFAPQRSDQRALPLPWTLVSADVVRGRRLTSFWHDGVPEDIKAVGGIWEDNEIVVDRNLITARCPLDLPAFTRELMKRVAA
jgi:protease I